MRVICFACHGWHMPPCDCQPGPGGTGDGVMPRWWIDSPGDPGPLFTQAVDASSTLPRSPMDVPPSRRVGFGGGEQGEFRASRDLPNHRGRTFLLPVVLPANFWGSFYLGK